MTEPPNRNDDSVPLDRFSHWFPPFAPAAAPTRQAVHDDPPATPEAEQHYDLPAATPEAEQHYDLPAAVPENEQPHDLPAATPENEQPHDPAAAAPEAERRRDLPPPPAPTWLSADDEPSPPPPVRGGRGKGRGKRKLGVGVAAIAVAGGGAALFLAQSDDEPSPSAVAQSTVAPTTAPPTSNAPSEPVADESPSWCVEARDGETVVGNGPGGTTNGFDAILAFDHAYYVDRDGAKARAVGAPDAEMGSAADIQGGIDTLPVGTEHCLTITETGIGRYAVTLSELRPNGSMQRYKQVVTTADVGGRTYITSIGASN
ncbi:hypothetical protein [Rhodococcus sp. WMMA185]|uniref:hypothetical protein n=1 Tax=Rhodococcus sp. WMMA185 TaxID=679318 RepID=UPI000AFA0824|nr:hypothetical protein [Rhodococcus sp. WMMA185]